VSRSALEKRVDAFLEPLRRDLLAAAVGLHGGVGEVAGPPERLVEQAVRFAVLVGITLDDVDVEVFVDLLHEGRRPSPANLRPAARQRSQMGRDVVGPVCGSRASGAWQFGDQPLGLTREGRRGPAAVPTRLPRAVRDRR